MSKISSGTCVEKSTTGNTAICKYCNQWKDHVVTTFLHIAHDIKDCKQYKTKIYPCSSIRWIVQENGKVGISFWKERKLKHKYSKKQVCKFQMNHWEFIIEY